MTGEVLAVFRWPGKGFSAEPVESVALAPGGVTGDRVRVLTSGGSPVTALATPRLLRWRASPEGVRGPDGRAWRWDDPGLPDALSAHLGRRVALAHVPEGRPDVAGTIHLTVEASRAAMEEALGAPLDIRRFRPNLHLALDAPPWAEEGWVGRRLRIGAAELEVDHLCDRCAVTTRHPDRGDTWADVLRWVNRQRGTYFGFRCRVLAGAEVAPGDPVTG